MNLINKDKIQPEEQKKKKFYKIIRVKDGKTSSEEIKHKITAYVKKGKKLERVYLTQEQQNDPIFMMGLYNSNIHINDFYKPSRDLQQNVLYMKCYVRTMISAIIGTELDMNVALEKVLIDTKEALKNKEFVDSLISLYPSAGVVCAAKHVLIDSDTFVSFSKEQYNTFLNLIKNRSIEQLVVEAKYNDGEILEILDTSHELYKDVAIAAVKMYGFEALKKINPEYVNENKDLVYLAHDTDGAFKLFEYVTVDLAPKKGMLKITQDILSKVKRDLLRDEIINKLLKNEFLLSGSQENLAEATVSEPKL